ncbi:MAG: CAP domain-containing protein, partial [Planctomycetota bacterium]
SLTIRTFFRNASELEFITYNGRVMEWNAALESVAAKLERRQVEITNEYRIMMGRRALFIDDILVKTARGHSNEMSREGYFSHFSPHPERRTPVLRAKIEGYKGGAISENIHRGSGMPEGAHYGWVHSSGHHRNILRRLWTQMGVGVVANHWTQNFGRTKPMTFPDEGK